MGGAHKSDLRTFQAGCVCWNNKQLRWRKADKLGRNVSLISISTFDMCQAKLSSEHFIVSLTQLLYLYESDLVFSPPTAPATPTLKELSNALDSVVNWHLLGVKLGLQDHELRTIEQNHRGDGNERCKHEMLGRWLRNAKLPTWKAVVDALQQMGEQAVALDVQAKYCTDTGKPTYSTPSLRPEVPVHVVFIFTRVVKRNIKMIYSSLQRVQVRCPQALTPPQPLVSSSHNERCVE